MTTSLVVVALPAKDDYVWRISTEKVPHMTLLFLGEMKDAGTTQRIVDYVEHATRTSLHRFGMSVVSRGELGPDKADVVFFDKRMAQVPERFRADLFANNDVVTAYNTSEQYPEWTPHLTLGYPETPAKPDTRDYPGVSWVNFDRIAVWTGDFEGPEFALSSDEGLELAMSNRGGEAVQAFLEHHGVKGMRWGFRRDRTGSSGPAEVTVKVKPGHGVVKTSGGHQHAVSEEAVRAAAVRQVAKVSSTHALTNKDLQDAITRMNLEQSYARLTATKKSAGRAFVEKLVSDTAKTEVSALSKGEVGPLMGQIDHLLGSTSTGRHTTKVLTVVTPASGRHRR